MTWHVDLELLDRYVEGQLPDAAAWSVETHLTACGTCRNVLEEQPTDGPPLDSASRHALDDARLAAVWSEVADRVHARQRPLVERALVRLGVADHDARLLTATPSLTGSWLLGVTLVLAAGVAAAWLAPSGSDRPLFGFLLLAPLVPLAGVAVAFGPRVDPVYELGIVAPMSSSRLLLLRAVAVLASSVALAGLGALALPVWSWSNGAWLLPSLTLTAVVLAASTRWSPQPAAALVAVGWVTAVIGLELRPTVPLVAFGATMQLVMALLLATSLLVLGVGREQLDPAARA